MTAPERTDAPLVITLFGPMQVLVQGQPLPHLRSRKTLWLLALLTLRHGRHVGREWLAGMLWPDTDQTQAFANLRPALSELRRALGSQSERLQSPSRHTLMLELAGAEVDLITFDSAMESKKLAALKQAVMLYHGPLLEGCLEEWVHQERAVREQNCLQALLKLAEDAVTAGDYEAATGCYQRAVGIDPLWEAARRGWMEALAKSGDSNAALHIYREFVELLKREGNATPDEKTSALYARLRGDARQRAGVQPVAMPAITMPRVTGHLPHPLTDLVGREDEREEVAVRLRRSRLVTLTGLGGIGKTRLAIAVAAEVVLEFTDGVWLIALETLSDARLIPRHIAALLGLQETPDQSLLQSVTDHLRDKRLLLVVDNCEHLLEGSARVIENLLKECAGIRILATSREALGITGEATWTVPALAVPDPRHLPQGRATMLRVLSSYESVQLFVERAQALQKTFTLTANNALPVAQVCAQLEGIPLALELAAARVKVLTVEQIAERLNDHLGLLTGGSRTAQSRQQTLRATLDWSYALLSEPERVVLRRLAVFAGGWSLEAAETVCAGEGIEDWQVLDLLTSLVDKSLVVFEEREPETGGRYRLLEVVRQYAAEMLQAHEEAAKVKSRHRDWFVGLVEKAEPHLTGTEQGKWLRRLDVEHDNLRAALAWSERDGSGIEAGLRLSGALWRYWYMRGAVSEGAQLLEQALKREGAQVRTAARAKALNGAGALAYYRSDNTFARALFEESLNIRRELGDPRGSAEALNNLGNIAYNQSDYARAQVLYQESLNMRREIGDRQGIALTLSNLGHVARAQGKLAATRALIEESLTLFRELGDSRSIAWALNGLAIVAQEQDEYASARSLHEESLRLFRDLGEKRGIAWSLHKTGNLDYTLGDAPSAHLLYAESLALFREIGDKRGTAWTLYEQGYLAQKQSDARTARTLYQESLRLFDVSEDRQGVVNSLRQIAEVLVTQAEGDESGVAEIQAAVRLWGAVHTLYKPLSAAPRSFTEQEMHDRHVEQARSALGEAPFATAWEEGNVLSWEQAVDYALKNLCGT